MTVPEDVDAPPGFPVIGRFRLRIVEVDAFRYLPGCVLPDWFLNYLERWPRRFVPLEEGKMEVRGREGWRVLEHGCWVVMRPSGHLSVVSPDDFVIAYEPIPAEAEILGENPDE